MVAMTADQASIRAEIFQRLDAYLDKSRREVRRKPARARRDPSHRTAPHLDSRECDDFRAVVVPARLPRLRRARAHRPRPVRYAQGTLKSNELYELVRLTAAFGVDGLPDGANTRARAMPTRDSPTRRQPRPSSSSFVSTTVNRLADDRDL